MMGALFILTLAVGMIVATALLRAWVLICLWEWFIVASFGVTMINIPTAIGITLIAGMLTQHNAKTSTGEKKDTSTLIGEIFGLAVVGPLLVLFMGWIVKGFM
jgi:hypothetical protein